MEVRFSRSATRALLRSNKRSLIREKIGRLALDPSELGPNVLRLQAREEYRLRVQDWRVIFRIEDGVLWIDDIGPRGSVY